MFFNDLLQKLNAFEDRVNVKLKDCVGYKEMDDALIKLNENFESSRKKN